MAEVLTLSWDDFSNKCPKAFKNLWLDTDLSDVTLATEDGGQLTAHKVILAACSPLFKRLLQKNPNGHPLLLYLMGVKLSELQQVLSYIYLGQCDLTQEQLPAFMATGKQLEVDGLTGDLEEGGEPASQFSGDKLQEKLQSAAVGCGIPLNAEELRGVVEKVKIEQEERNDEEKFEYLSDNVDKVFQK